MRRNILSLSILTILASSLLIFQNCGKGSKHVGTVPTTSAQGSFDNSQDIEHESISGTGEKVSPDRQVLDLYKRLAGVTLSRTSNEYTAMLNHINAGQPEKAAAIALQAGTFYTVTVRDFAGKMSTREATTLAPLSDFVATVIGVVRDDLPATDLVTANYTYRARGVAGVSDDELTALIRTNLHYEQLEEKPNYHTLLEKTSSQRILNPSGAIVNHTDAAGLMTTRAFMLAHANAGTNRRIIEYAFKMFECTSIDSWASTSNPDDHVGRDIGRFPVDEYNNKCKGCHTGMDALRPATAYYDFNMLNETTKEGYIKYRFTTPTDPNPVEGQPDIPVAADEQLVSSKFRRGADTFPLGYVVKDENWTNYSDSNTFGWTFTSGSGMNDFGNMIAYSEGFRRCMVKRVFSTVCKYELSAADNALANKLANDFKYSGYNLKDLFVDVALRPECLGVER